LEADVKGGQGLTRVVAPLDGWIKHLVGFEVLTAVSTKMAVFWVVTAILDKTFI
jgi:hypothetical protein